MFYRSVLLAILGFILLASNANMLTLTALRSGNMKAEGTVIIGYARCSKRFDTEEEAGGYQTFVRKELKEMYPSMRDLGLGINYDGVVPYAAAFGKKEGPEATALTANFDESINAIICGR